MDLRVFLFTVIAEVLGPVTDVVDPALIVHDIYKMELADCNTCVNASANRSKF